MKALLYCVCFDRGTPPPPCHGVDGRPVILVAGGGLSAATSRVDEAALVPSLERVRAYEAVVEALFRDGAVVPMRYGSAVESEAAVERLLEEQAGRFTALLGELDECVEMGLRVAAAPSASASTTGAAEREGPESPPKGSSPGHSYLAALSDRLRVEQRAAASEATSPGAVDRYREAFAGLYVKVRAEHPAPLKLAVGISDGKLRISQRDDDSLPGRLSRSWHSSLAVYFLVPRPRVAAFRETFRELSRGTEGLELSGPWPPYNFV